VAEQTEREKVPVEAVRSFEHVEGIPLDVIGELLARAGVPAELQNAFWQEVAAKEYKKITGKVIQIETTSGASERVLIVAPNGDFEYFYYGGEGPLDLNDAQFDTLKLAADGGRTVTVSYQWEPDPRPYYAGTKPVNSVAVWF